MPDNVMLQEAIEAVRQGQAGRARDLLTRLLRADSSNPEYWLWLSAVVETQKEQVFCLESVLRYDPENAAARQGLVLLGAAAPDPNVAPVPPLRRQWAAAAEEPLPATGLGRLWANPVLRYASLAAAVVITGLLIAWGVFGVGRPPAVASLPTRTPGPSPTITLTPTALGARAEPPTRTPRRTPVPTTLAMLLEATYTPTPIYAATPHPISEAYSAGLRAFKLGNWEKAAGFFEQARQVDPQAADIVALLAECYANRGEHTQAQQLFEQAIETDPAFAPAYLGLARERLALDPQADVAGEIAQAIELDPGYGEAFLENAAYQIGQGDAEAALASLDEAGELLPGSPRVPLLRAQAALSAEDYETALDQGLEAIELDLTLLPAYRIAGQAAAALGERSTAIKNLQVYLAFSSQDAAAWAALGQAYLSGENRPAKSRQADLEAALDAFTRAIEAATDEAEQAPVYLQRGLAYLEMDRGQEAVNDLLLARSLMLKDGERSFPVELALGRALWAAGRVEDARGQFNAAGNLAGSALEEAEVYYYRAQVSELLDMQPAALRDWQALQDLDEAEVPAEWLEVAAERLAPTATPTPTATRTAVRTPTRTPRPSPTVKFTPTRTPRAESTPRPGLTATATPAITRTAVSTRTPRPTTTPRP